MFKAPKCLKIEFPGSSHFLHNKKCCWTFLYEIFFRRGGEGQKGERGTFYGSLGGRVKRILS